MRLRGWAVAVLAAGLVTALPTIAAAPPGWNIAGNAPADYEFGVDTTTAASGKRSASITAKPDAKPNGFGILMQIIAADNYRGTRLRLSGYLRTQAANRAEMWMRVDGPGGKVLGFDNMDSRPLIGTTGWTRYDIVLDVPSDSVDIAFGFLLISGGKVWGDDFKLEKVDRSVPVTSAGPTLARAPTNLDFEDTDSSQTAVWTERKLSFQLPFPTVSCDMLRQYVEDLLLELGARASGLDVNTRRCYLSGSFAFGFGPNGATVNGVGTGAPGLVDATFWVLVPINKTDGNTASEKVEARWQTVDVSTNPFVSSTHSACLQLESATKQILSSFPTSGVKPIADCRGLRAEVLMPSQ